MLFLIISKDASIITSLVKVVAPKLLELPAAVTLDVKVPDVAVSAAVVVFPKLLELPEAVTLALKVPEVPE